MKIVKQDTKDGIIEVIPETLDDLWHLSHRLTRKILAHNFCFILNKKLGNPPLQFELLIKC